MAARLTSPSAAAPEGHRLGSRLEAEAHQAARALEVIGEATHALALPNPATVGAADAELVDPYESLARLASAGVELAAVPREAVLLELVVEVAAGRRAYA